MRICHRRKLVYAANLFARFWLKANNCWEVPVLDCEKGFIECGKLTLDANGNLVKDETPRERTVGFWGCFNGFVVFVDPCLQRYGNSC